MMKLKDLFAGVWQSCAEMLDLPFDIDFENHSGEEASAASRIWGAYILILLFGAVAVGIAYFARALLPPVGAALLFAAVMMVASELKDSGRPSRAFGELFAGWTSGKFSFSRFISASQCDEYGSEATVAYYLLGAVKFLIFAYICYSGKISLAVAFFAADFLARLWFIYSGDQKVATLMRLTTVAWVIALMCFQTQVVFFAAVVILLLVRALRKQSSLPPETIALAGNIAGSLVLFFTLIFAA